MDHRYGFAVVALAFGVFACEENAGVPGSNTEQQASSPAAAEEPAPSQSTATAESSAPSSPAPAGQEDKDKNATPLPTDCAGLASAKPTGSFTASGNFADAVKGAVDVRVDLRDGKVDVQFTNESNVYSQVGAMKSTSSVTGFVFSASESSFGEQGGYTYEFGYDDTFYCDRADGVGGVGGKFFTPDAKLTITKMDTKTVEGSIALSPTDSITFVAPVVGSTPTLPATLCCK